MEGEKVEGNQSGNDPVALSLLSSVLSLLCRSSHLSGKSENKLVTYPLCIQVNLNLG